VLIMPNSLSQRFVRYLDSRWCLPGIITLGLVIRVLLLTILPQQPFSDGVFYMDRARELLAGIGFQDQGSPTAYWPPGQTFLIAGTMAVFGTSLLGPMLLNLVCAGVITWLTAWFGTRLCGNHRVGLVAAALYAVYPAHIAYTGTPLSETSSTALIMAGLAMMIARRDSRVGLFGAGLVFGVATLVRAQLMYFPAGVLVALVLLYADFSWRRAVLGGLVLYLGLIATVLPWSLRNQRVLGSFVLVSTNGGVALSTGASPEATGDHVEWDRAMWERSGVPFEQRISRQVEVDRNLKKQASNWIKQNPGRYISMMPKKAALLWMKDSDGFWGLKGSYPALDRPLTIAQWVNQAFYMLLLLLSLPCLWAGLSGWLGRDLKENAPLLMLFLMPAFSTLTAILFTGQVRYHFGAMPFLVAAAAWTLMRLATRKDPVTASA
jgi:4-amino-4-deoxy-L-arabinose transferase-like glycosyltransferase